MLISSMNLYLIIPTVFTVMLFYLLRYLFLTTARNVKRVEAISEFFFALIFVTFLNKTTYLQLVALYFHTLTPHFKVLPQLNLLTVNYRQSTFSNHVSILIRLPHFFLLQPQEDSHFG